MRNKIWLVTATILVIAGCLLFVWVMTVLKWDFSKLSTDKYVTNTYEINENFSSVSVDTDTADIVFVPSERCTVVCFEQNKVRHSVDVIDGTLVIKAVDTRKWYEYVGINFSSPKITVYLPESEYAALTIKTSTGNVEIPKELGFENVDISQSTGGTACYAPVSETLKVKTSTGSIRVESASVGALDLAVSTGRVTVSDVVCKGEAKIKVSTGRTVMTNVKCQSLTTSGSTGNITLENVVAADTLNIKRSTGNVRLDMADASEIFIKTDTGSVEGSLLTAKVFIAKTDTGRISVPDTTSGGRCEITTDTGDIKITVKS